MLTMTLKRLAMAIPSLIGVVIVTFLLTRALPGDPAVYFAGPTATPQAIQEIRVKLGLDQPLLKQFGHYVVDLAHGNLGTSLTTGQPVASELRQSAARLRRADAARAHRLHRDRGAARHPRGDQAELAARPCLPCRRHARRVGCRCSSPASFWFMSFIISSAGRRRRSAGSTCSSPTRRTSPASF